MQRRQFLFSLATLTVAALVPRVALTQTEQSKSESYIAFPQGRKIVLLRPSGEVLRELTPALPEDALINYLSATQNGKRFCFEAGVGWRGGNKLTIYTLDSDGSNLQVIKPQSNLIFSTPTISPDGTLISCRPDVEKSTLHVMRLDGSLQDMGESTLGAGASRFSRDGQTIYFTNGPHLYHIPTSGGEAQVVLRGHYPEPFDVGPQNTTIAVVPIDNIVKRLATISPEGKVTSLPGLPGTYYSGVAWSPDGRECVFTRGYSAVGAKDGGMFITSVDAPKPRHLTEDYGGVQSIVWR